MSEWESRYRALEESAVKIRDERDRFRAEYRYWLRRGHDAERQRRQAIDALREIRDQWDSILVVKSIADAALVKLGEQP